MINYDSIADSSSSALKISRDFAGSSSSSSDGSRTRTRPRVEVITEIENNSMTEEGQQHPEGTAADRSVTSQLTIRHVTDMDSGNYTCAPSNAEPASTMVYVSEGKLNEFFIIFRHRQTIRLCHMLFGLLAHYMKIALKTTQAESHKRYGSVWCARHLL